MDARCISHFLMLGDSLSDRGIMYKSTMLGCIPMSKLSGLEGKSPLGRFDDHYVWSDAFGAKFAEKFLMDDEKMQHPGITSEDIADAIIEHRKKFEDHLATNFDLDHAEAIRYRDHDFIRNFDIGGLTAHNYAWQPSTSISRFFSRLILENLTSMRKKLLAYDEAHNISGAQKMRTLVIEWSGANDLITVNAEPSDKEVDLAIEARIRNVEELIKHGYLQFALFNMPDLSLTPRFQAKTQAEQDKASECCQRFNRLLTQRIARLRVMYPHCQFDEFDVATEFKQIHDHPAQFGFDSGKLTTYFTNPAEAHFQDEDTKITPQSPAKDIKRCAAKYMFWDDVHPTSHVHELLAEKFYEQMLKKYNVAQPQNNEAFELSFDQISERALIKAFNCKYKELLYRDKHGSFSSLRQFDRKMFNNKNLSLFTILNHALFEDGERSKEAIVNLGWIDEHGNLKLPSIVLAQALERVCYFRTLRRSLL